MPDSVNRWSPSPMAETSRRWFSAYPLTVPTVTNGSRRRSRDWDADKNTQAPALGGPRAARRGRAGAAGALRARPRQPAGDPGCSLAGRAGQGAGDRGLLRLPQQPDPLAAAEPCGAVLLWLLTRDVEQGRDELNFSSWDEDDGEADDAADAVAEGSMPPRRYVLVHPDAALDEAERQVLVDALEAMDRQRR